MYDPNDPTGKRVFAGSVSGGLCVNQDPSVAANPRGVKAILDADVVVLGPGDLYTSVIPNLLAQGIPQALADTQATRIYACNLMTKPGETDDFKASGFVREIIHYLGGPNLDWTLINAQEISKDVREAYLVEGARPVYCDVEAVRRQVPGVFVTQLGNNQIPLNHNQSRIAEAVLRIADMGRIQKTLAGGNSHSSRVPSSQLPVLRWRC